MIEWGWDKMNAIFDDKKSNKNASGRGRKDGKKIIHFLVILSAGFALLNAQAGELEMRGSFELQNRVFFHEALMPKQPDYNLSFAATPEFFLAWNNRNDTLEFAPSIRLDQHDDERTHADIREFSWVHVGNDWESRFGIRRVFWGVTEFQHLVDVINQTDAVEDIDGEDKLGQPMINLSLVRGWGVIDFYILPYFRKRTFPGEEGRPNPFVINADDPIYESPDGQNHIDWAARWAHSFSDYEVAISWFQGTSREPLIIVDNFSLESEKLVPFYQQTKRLGFEMQANFGGFLWKLESIHNQNNQQDFSAAQVGFEYASYGVWDSNTDLGWLIEYAWDERGINFNPDADSNFVSTFQNDLFFGNRILLNDVSSTEILMALVYDLDFESNGFLVEAGRRVGNNVKLLLDVRLFEADDRGDMLGMLLRKDDFIQVTAQYFY